MFSFQTAAITKTPNRSVEANSKPRSALQQLDRPCLGAVWMV